MAFLYPTPWTLALASGRAHAWVRMHTHTHTPDRSWETDTVKKEMAIVQEISPRGGSWGMSMVKVRLRTRGEEKERLLWFCASWQNPAPVWGLANRFGFPPPSTWGYRGVWGFLKEGNSHSQETWVSTSPWILILGIFGLHLRSFTGWSWHVAFF